MTDDPKKPDNPATMPARPATAAPNGLEALSDSTPGGDPKISERANAAQRKFDALMAASGGKPPHLTTESAIIMMNHSAGMPFRTAPHHPTTVPTGANVKPLPGPTTKPSDKSKDVPDGPS